MEVLQYTLIIIVASHTCMCRSPQTVRRRFWPRKPTKNGFTENKLLQAVSESPHQTISYCGVNAHHQNGVAEKRIRDLQELSRTSVMHAQQRWSNAIISNLWTFALEMANEVHQYMPSLKYSISPLEKFSQVAVRPKISSLRHFGCLVYVLENALATGKSLPKREDFAQVGIYLAPTHYMLGLSP